MKKLIFLFVLFTSFCANAQNENNAYVLKVVAWPTKVCAVCWENPTPEMAREMALVQSAVSNTWERESRLRFTGWGRCTSASQGIRIRIDDSGPHCKGLGRQLNGVADGMVLNFTYRNWSPACVNSSAQRDLCISSIAVHEFGHAIGFAHEQNRTDCHFEGCEEEPQGSNGDWVTACDINSVMNYCNPTYNNDGKLSFYDKQAVTTFYGFPVSNSPSLSEVKVLSLVHTASLLDTTNNAAISRSNPGFHPISHEVKVYLSGTDEELANVKKVTYKLHRTFRRRKIAVTNASDKFGIGLRVWGEFVIHATVLFNDGHTKELDRDLVFDPKEGVALRKDGNATERNTANRLH